MKNNKNVILVILIGIIVLIGVFSVSYSYFKSQVTGVSNIDNLVAGKVRLDLLDDLSVSKTNIVPGDYIEKEFSVANVGDVPTYYKVIWENLESTFLSDEIVLTMQCSQYLDTENGVLEAGACEGVENQAVKLDNTDILGPLYIEPNITHKYKIRITFIETGSEQNYNKLQKFKGTITISGINGKEKREWYDYCDTNSKDLKCKIIADNQAYADNVSSPNVASASGIDFSKPSSESNGRGLYYTNLNSNNEGGTRVYYYRGDVQNNHLLLGGYCFRIIRTNEDGSLRLRFNGVSSDGTCNEKGTAVSIGKSKYNNNSNDNAYVGYMYGNPNASTYESAHANTNNSTIKSTIDNWYSNITSKDINLLADSIYCSDRSISSKEIVGGINNLRMGFEKNATIYSGLSRLVKDEELVSSEKVLPVLKCLYNSDKYTLDTQKGGTSGKGNNSLIYPVGLMSADEMIYAGVTYNKEDNSSNTDSYLYTGENYWSMTPADYDDKAYVLVLNNKGYINVAPVDSEYSVVPVVSLSSKATIKSGNGTSNSPYETEIKYKVAVGTDTITYGTIVPTTKIVDIGRNAEFEVTPKYGYKYVSNSCDALYENNTLTIEDVQGDMTCNVVFEPREYTLSYNSDGGSICESKTVIYNEKVGPLCVPTKARKNFVGWYLSSDNTINVTENTITTGDMPLIAKWISPTYTLTYDNNTGSGCTNKTVTLDSEYGTMCVPVKNGYTFTGWYDSKTGGNKIETTDIYTTMDNTTVYAHWMLTDFTLTYDNTGGNGCSSKTITYTKEYGELCTPTRTGYTFAGWYTDATNGNEVTSSTVLTVASNQTIYAHWTPNTYTLTYNNNGGSGCNTKSVTYASAYGALCTPTRTGYSFTGWYTDANGGSQVTASTTTTGNATIYAHWTPNKYTLTYNNNGGSGCTTKEIIYNSAYGDLCTPTRQYYTFLGWFTAASGGTQVTSSTKLTSAANQTIYAHWKISTLSYGLLASNYQCGTTATDKLVNYTGTCQLIDEGSDNWKIKLTSSGTLRISLNTNIDAFIVGAGGGGVYQLSSKYDTCLSARGGGGYHKTFSTTLSANTDYSVTVGKPNGGSTTAFGQTVAGGGTGYLSAGENYGGSGSSATGEFGTSGSEYSGWMQNGSAPANTGKGGGGGSGSCYYGGSYSGGSGIVIIRNKR